MLSGTLHREAGAVPRVERALRRGRGGALLRSARVLLGASALLDLLPGRSRARRAASGTLALAGTLALRFGVVAAGRYSARDPQATFAMQRAGRGAAELVTREEAPSMPSIAGVDATGKELAEHHGAAPA